MGKSNLIHGRTCVYNVNYHLVWSTKYRRKVLTDEITTALTAMLREIGEEKGFSVAQAEVGEHDHVHVFVSAHPKVSPSYIAKMLKGISARRLFMQYPTLKNQLWKGHLWNSSFYLETVGSVSEDAIRKYIEHQQTRG